MPLRIKPDFGQVSEYGYEPSSSESWDVFNDHPSGPNCANDPSELVPKTGPSTGEASTLSGNADVLAGETTADEVNAPLALRRERPHIFVLRDFRPVLLENCGCIRVNLHLPLAFHTRSFKAEREATDPCE
jgi:hypothetical protein